LEKGDVFKHLGRLVSLIYQANLSKADKLLTGYLFDESFLKMARAIARESDKEASFKQVCLIVKAKDPSYSATVDLAIEPTLGHKNSYLEALGEAPVTELLPDDPMVKEAREYMIPFYQAADRFCEGFTESFRTALITQDLTQLNISFQGKPVTLEGVLGALRIENDQGAAFSPKSLEIIRAFQQGDLRVKEELIDRLRRKQEERASDPAQNSSSSDFGDKVDWLVEALALADRTWLEQFVFSVTGKKALLPGMTIKLKPDTKDVPTFEIHTCFNSITIPRGTFRQNDFVEALKNVTQGDNYNIG
jgi:hypothetical protein